MHIERLNKNSWTGRADNGEAPIMGDADRRQSVSQSQKGASAAKHFQAETPADRVNSQGKC